MLEFSRFKKRLPTFSEISNLPLISSDSVLSLYCFGFALAFALTWPLLLGGFSIVDDHVEVAWLNERLSNTPIWPALLHIKIGALANTRRFRPLYDVYLQLETWLFGDRPALYHLMRILYLGMFLGSVGWATARCIKPIFAYALMVVIAGLTFSADMWCHSLGPAEQLASVGVCLVLIAGTKIIAQVDADRTVPNWALPMASLGAALAAGAKENFIFLSGATVVFVLVLAATRKLRPLAAVLAVPPLIVPAFNLSALAAAGKKPTDFYGVDNSVAHRLLALVQQPIFLIFALGAVGLAAWLCLYAERHSPLERKRLQREILMFFALTAFLAAYMIWEVFFYNGRLPSGIRYDFPIALLPLAIAVAFAGFIRSTAIDFDRLSRRRAWAGLAVLAAGYLLTFHVTFALPSAAVRSAVGSNLFRKDFLATRAIAAKHPNWPLVLEAESPWDFEKVATFDAWARHYGVLNPVELRIEIPPEKIHGGFEQWLTDRMKQWSLEGVPGKFGASPDPGELVKLGGQCFAIGVSSPPISPCERLPLMQWRY